MSYSTRQSFRRQKLLKRYARRDCFPDESCLLSSCFSQRLRILSEAVELLLMPAGETSVVAAHRTAEAWLGRLLRYESSADRLFLTRRQPASRGNRTKTPWQSSGLVFLGERSMTSVVAFS